MVKLEWGKFNTLKGSNTYDKGIQTDISIFGLNNELSLFAPQVFKNVAQPFESPPSQMMHIYGMQNEL